VIWFNALQIALAAGVAVLIARRVRILLFEAPVDIKPFADALESAIGAGQLQLARQIAEACVPAWPARLASSGLAELERGGSALAVIEEAQLDFEAQSWRGLGAIVALGRMASPLAFIGVILEIGRAFGGGSGVEGLQRGLLASRALERSLFTFALGVATFAVCFAGATILQRRARRVRADLQRVASLLVEREVQ
jgi:hypothetical protein